MDERRRYCEDAAIASALPFKTKRTTAFPVLNLAFLAVPCRRIPPFLFRRFARYCSAAVSERAPNDVTPHRKSKPPPPPAVD
ncbi:Hypothetical protein NTJ_06936 [Nesidiocoris tenuis]|uniref:Uncharacterized protein n=1 Tax=Nesidiocoris tenuis TaxID=355587 RepID=A0ABN7ARZ8_9HEMI|nr:Hypothetical protein NTJ_06936 [Nesidiocoris tenuis]